jgi:tRNA-splicing ligase RtcB
MNEKWRSAIPAQWQLAFLPVDNDEGLSYIREMQYCVDFALANRTVMMERAMSIVQRHFSSRENEGERNPIINIAHNYAARERHFNEFVMVHRKGATLATKDTTGIIPGSQGTASYIVKGKGNPESFTSCSHGAGRKMGRKEAQRSLSLSAEIKKLDVAGILLAVRTEKDLDEAPGAYKNIDEVMENQNDLVSVLVKLTPLAVIKG